MRTVPPLEDTDKLILNMSSIRNMCNELGVDFVEGPKEFVTPCIFHPDTSKQDGGKPNLYINVQHKPGIYHCFKCDAKGSFATYVSRFTGWGPFKVAAFIRKHRATSFGPETPQKDYIVQVTDAELRNYAFRHEYCYDRKLNEETLRRYKIGFDQEQNAITLPWFDRVGKLCGVKRRTVNYKYNHMSSNGDSRALLYGLHLIKPRSIVWIAEGEFDAMYLDQIFRQFSHTEHSAIALGGKFLHDVAITELLKKTPRAIVLTLDADDAGREAQNGIYLRVRPIVFTINLEYKGGKDPNELSEESIIKYAKKARQQITQHEQQQQMRFAMKGQHTCAD